MDGRLDGRINIGTDYDEWLDGWKATGQLGNEVAMKWTWSLKGNWTRVLVYGFGLRGLA